jgi:hypothetical protein
MVGMVDRPWSDDLPGLDDLPRPDGVPEFDDFTVDTR